MRNVWIFIFFLFSVNPCFAIQKIFALHINGVNTTRDEAKANTDALEQTAQVKSNLLSNNGHFDLLYNKMDDAAFCKVCNHTLMLFV